MRALNAHQQSVQTSLERLATGKKINRASDDPSGVIVADELKYRQLKIDKQIERFEFEETRLGATEGALAVVQDMLHQLNGLAVTNANTGGLSDEEREAIGVEAQSIIDGINQVATNTFFKGEQILAGRVPDLGGLAEALAKDPERAQAIAENAVDSISGDRGSIGNRLREIDSERNALLAEFEGNAGVLSSIEDTDYAAETASLVRAQILEQATIKAIQIDREQAGRVLDLISGVPPVGPKAL